MNNKMRNAAFYTSLETRKFEIELFWKRSLFFWGFIASAFIAYIELSDNASLFRFPLAGFGCICSLVWTLANRGSKFWQENWEKKVSDLESPIVGSLFTKIEEPQKKFFLLRARKYSVSKLVIALSDYVLMIWTCILIGDLLSYFELINHNFMESSLKAFFIGTILYGFYIFIFCKTSKNNTKII